MENSTSEYLFQSLFEMLLEYMQRRSELEEAEFNKNIEQKMNQDMGTQVKTMFEAAEERGAAKILRRTIEGLIQETKWADAKIAHVLRTTEDLVKQVRLELVAATLSTLPAAAQPLKKAQAKKPPQPKTNKKIATWQLFCMPFL